MRENSVRATHRLTTHCAAVLVIGAAALVFFLELVWKPTGILYSGHSDLLALHLPSKCFLVKSWQETGELPLWNPHSFSGSPFIHDIQVSAFYPLHWPLFLVSDHSIGPALSWLVILQIAIAGWCMYAYGIHRGLPAVAAFVAALGYMFAGKWLIHVLTAGHYNMLPLAWLPLVLLWLERAIQRKSLLRAAWAGAAFSLFIVCAYPYVTLYAGVFIALWSLGAALETNGGFERSNRLTLRQYAAPLMWWALCGCCTLLTATAVGAVQLLPALDAATEATRSMGVAPSMSMLNGCLHALCMIAGRATIGENMWEYEGAFGVLWLLAAALAPALLSGRTRFETFALVVVLLYAYGLAVVLQWLPGFRLFRLPTRMLLVAAFPIAFLAAKTTQALFYGPDTCHINRQRIWGVISRVGIVMLIIVGGYTAANSIQGQSLHLHAYWLFVPATVVLFCQILRATTEQKPVLFLGSAQKPRMLLWCALLLFDLWSLAGALVHVRSANEIFDPASSVTTLVQKVDGSRRRVMDRAPIGAISSPLWPALPEMLGLESTGGFNPTDVRRYKEYLQLITDAHRPLRPPLGDFTLPVLGSFVIRNKSLLDLLGVHFLLQPTAYTIESSGERSIADDPRWQAIFLDANPRTFDFEVGGFQHLPSYTLYENREAFPRVFVVPEARPLPGASHILDTVKKTNFHRVVLLERMCGKEPLPAAEFDFTDPPEPAKQFKRTATMLQYLPNHVTIEVSEGPAAYLVLADIWFPGWVCTVNAKPAEIYRGNYLFRVVKLPAEAAHIVFSFAPMSYTRGKFMSMAAIALLLGFTGIAAIRNRTKRSRALAQKD